MSHRPEHLQMEKRYGTHSILCISPLHYTECIVLVVVFADFKLMHLFFFFSKNIVLLWNEGRLYFVLLRTLARSAHHFERTVLRQSESQICDPWISLHFQVSHSWCFFQLQLWASDDFVPGSVVMVTDKMSDVFYCELFPLISPLTYS